MAAHYLEEGQTIIFLRKGNFIAFFRDLGQIFGFGGYNNYGGDLKTGKNFSLSFVIMDA